MCDFPETFLYLHENAHKISFYLIGLLYVSNKMWHIIILAQFLASSKHSINICSIPINIEWMEVLRYEVKDELPTILTFKNLVNWKIWVQIYKTQGNK